MIFCRRSACDLESGRVVAGPEPVNAAPPVLAHPLTAAARQTVGALTSLRQS
jgi:hypothetical protein